MGAICHFSIGGRRIVLVLELASEEGRSFAGVVEHWRKAEEARHRYTGKIIIADGRHRALTNLYTATRHVRLGPDDLQTVDIQPAAINGIDNGISRRLANECCAIGDDVHASVVPEVRSDERRVGTECVRAGKYRW